MCCIPIKLNVNQSLVCSSEWLRLLQTNMTERCWTQIRRCTKTTLTSCRSEKCAAAVVVITGVSRETSMPSCAEIKKNPKFSGLVTRLPQGQCYFCADYICHCFSFLFFRNELTLCNNHLRCFLTLILTPSFDTLFMLNFNSCIKPLICRSMDPTQTPPSLPFPIVTPCYVSL